MSERVLLLASKRTYRLDDVRAAAEKLGIALTLATDRCKGLAKKWRDGVLTLHRLEQHDACVDVIRRAHADTPFAAVIGTCDVTSELAAVTSSALGLPSNPPDAPRLARNKALLRQRLTAAGVRTPRFAVFPLDEQREADVAGVIAEVRARLGFPVVVKPLVMSGSRGVMRADDEGMLRSSLARLSMLLREFDAMRSKDPGYRQVLVEEFVPGVEVAVEGLLRDGCFEVLAFFDKPDPLDGPFFEETLYVTPSRLPLDVQQRTVGAVAAAASALGLVRGPVHAELRLTPVDGTLVPVVIEAAARSIGGLCARTLRFGTGRSLDEVVLEAALGRSSSSPPREGAASGVMMLPIPRAGWLHGVAGIDDAKAVPGIVELDITAREGEELVPLPEGTSYLGFLFARADTPDLVERALREAHQRLRFDIHGKLPTVA